MARLGVPFNSSLAFVHVSLQGIPFLRDEVAKLNPNAKNIFGQTPLHVALNTWATGFSASKESGLPTIASVSSDEEEMYMWG